MIRVPALLLATLAFVTACQTASPPRGEEKHLVFKGQNNARLAMTVYTNGEAEIPVDFMAEQGFPTDETALLTYRIMEDLSGMTVQQVLGILGEPAQIRPSDPARDSVQFDQDIMVWVSHLKYDDPQKILMTNGSCLIKIGGTATGPVKYVYSGDMGNDNCGPLREKLVAANVGS